MTRRDAIRAAVFAAFAGKLATLDAKGQLTVDLSQWHGIIFKLNDKSITITSAEIFAALQRTTKP